jgi:hypothetical protein
MEVTTRKKVLFGVVILFLFAACSLTGSNSGDNQADDVVPTLIVSPTTNLTVTAVFANATANAPSATTPGTSDDSPTDTPDSGSAVVPTSALPGIPYQETPAIAVVEPLEAYFLDDAPTIDGDLTDWAGEMYSMKAVVYGGEYYANEADLSGQFKIGWDSTYLYLGVVVFDTRYSQTAAGGQLYLGDSLEILVDANLAGDAAVTELNGDDFQIGISAGNLHDQVIPEAYMWYPSNRMAPLPSVKISGKLISGGWLVEVALPWGEVDVSPSNDLTLGFLLSISDNDMQNMNAQQTVVSFSALRELQNPTSWSELRLVNE